MEDNRKALKAKLAACRDEFEKVKTTNLELDLSRGKPSKEQLNLSMKLLDAVNSKSDTFSEDGMDCRNYGALDGIPEAKRLMGELLGTDPANVMVFGNSSLDLMFQTLAHAMIDGLSGCEPMLKQKDRKFLCPVPGYDRHFAITERFGFKLIPIPMNEDGPDMKLVRRYVEKDATVKGIWCVPKFSNPTGIIFSEEVVHAFSKLTPAAPDFRIYWDNAYNVHDLYAKKSPEIPDLLTLCIQTGRADRVYEFISTSKISFPGDGISAIACSENNKKDLLNYFKYETIGPDKMNQLRQVRYFKDLKTIRKHLEQHAKIMRPKFEMVQKVLTRRLEGKDLATWTSPRGGYFMSVDVLPGCAKKVVHLCKDLGVTFTPAGSTWPYGKDPQDSNLRIAPSFATIDEIKKATEVLALCIEIAGLEKLLKERK